MFDLTESFDRSLATTAISQTNRLIHQNANRVDHLRNKMVVGFLTTIATHGVSTAPSVPWLMPIMQRDETTLALVRSVRSPIHFQAIYVTCRSVLSRIPRLPTVLFDCTVFKSCCYCSLSLSMSVRDSMQQRCERVHLERHR